MRKRLLFVLVCAVVAVLFVVRPGMGHLSGPDATSQPTGDAGQVSIVSSRPSVPGYDRECGRDDGCVFGAAWSDDVDVAGGRNGCDTRNDVLRRDLRQVTIKPGTNGCMAQAGVLQDPYTGTQVRFDRSVNASDVQVDHVYPLAAAWDHGAAAWSAHKRRDFANDPRNLISTLGSVNQSKGDKTPGEWMPAEGRCRYAGAYIEVALAYGLSVSIADDQALRRAQNAC